MALDSSLDWIASKQQAKKIDYAIQKCLRTLYITLEDISEFADHRRIVCICAHRIASRFIAIRHAHDKQEKIDQKIA